MRKLRRPPKPGRAGVIVPNGTLFGDGVCARIKEELLRGLQSPYDRPPAQWGVRAIHAHSDKFAVFR